MNTASAPNIAPVNAKMPFGPPMKVLVVNPLDKETVRLLEILRQHAYHVEWRTGYLDALAYLETEAIPVAVCEARLPDGSWRKMLARLAALPRPPLLIVTSRLADERLWAEVLNLGGHDVLRKPYNPDEVVRVVSLACSRWHRNSGSEIGILPGVVSARCA